MALSDRRFKKTAQLVLAALNEISEKNGSSPETISNYIAKEFSVPDKDFKRYVPKAIETGVEFGAIRKFRGKYLLGDALNNDMSNRALKVNIVTTCNDGKGRRGRRGGGRTRRRKISRNRSTSKIRKSGRRSRPSKRGKSTL